MAAGKLHALGCWNRSRAPLADGPVNKSQLGLATRTEHEVGVIVGKLSVARHAPGREKQVYRRSAGSLEPSADGQRRQFQLAAP
jgi:hypothetical protein